MSGASPISSDRRPLSRLLGLLALLAVLCLPAAHALHLRLADDATAAVADHHGHDHDDAGTAGHPNDGHRHDAAHCAVCLSVQSIGHGVSVASALVACAFDAPATFPPSFHVAPPADAFVSAVAVPRGPPARG